MVSNKLLKHGFSASAILSFTRASITNPSLFTFHRGTIHLILLLYMDNIILTGNDYVALRCFMDFLGHEFEIKDLGHLHCFLGIEVRPMTVGLYLSQTKYTLNLLK